eukprot:6172565-Pleurochrysis_carterae.AAC.1
MHTSSDLLRVALTDEECVSRPDFRGMGLHNSLVLAKARHLAPISISGGPRLTFRPTDRQRPQSQQRRSEARLALQGAKKRRLFPHPSHSLYLAL